MLPATTPVPFSAEQKQWFEQACAKIDPKRLQRLLFDLTDIHSPTGATRAAGEFMVAHLGKVGFEAGSQPLTDTSGNVKAQYKGSGGGASVMLYAPIDTHLECTPAERALLTGPATEADMQPRAQQVDDWVFGLGASNPKGMIATL